MKAQKKKLIILTLHILTQHNLKALGCNVKNRNWEIEYWSILPLIKPKVFEEFFKKSSKIRYKNFYYIKSFKEFLKKSNSINNHFYYINNFNKSIVGLMTDIILSFRGGKRIFYFSGDFSGLSSIPILNIIYFYYNKDKIELLTKVFIHFFKRPYFLLLNLFFSKPKYYFYSNTNLFEKYKKIYGSNKVFAFQNNELQEFHKLKINNKKRDIVFIDQVRGEEFDAKVNKSIFTPNQKKINQYWADVNLFLKHIEKLLKNSKVKIAAHPRRFKRNYPIKRKFFFNQTLKLIMNSQVVISSVSNSLLYALLMQKPIILIKQKMFDYYSPITVVVLKIVQKRLDIPLIDINDVKELNSINKKKILQFDKKKYKDYLTKVLQINKFKNKKNIIEEIIKNVS